jgi:hypothetical protein
VLVLLCSGCGAGAALLWCWCCWCCSDKLEIH